MKETYVCSNCHKTYTKWVGKCDECGDWNTVEVIKDHLANSFVSNATKNKGGKNKTAKEVFNEMVLHTISDEIDHIVRLHADNSEFDRVCGGGLVQGSALLIGGEPGIGKSTLLMQIVAQLAQQISCIYVSGEESVNQVSQRALRLGLEKQENFQLANNNSLREILNTLNYLEQKPQLLVIDSIQTIYLDMIDGIMGSVSQIKACAAELINFCKKYNIILLIVGHVTRDGNIAGPKTLEHMLDTVLYFEGEKKNNFRILRAIKNRFGATDEIGIFEMTELGLKAVDNPSLLFLDPSLEDNIGSALFASMEGIRCIIVEIQSLLLTSNFNPLKRAVVGTEVNRLSMISAVLEARNGIVFSNKDIYLNIIGGLKIIDPGMDLAIAASLISSFFDIPIKQKTLFLGELSLSGKIRPISYLPKRINEAHRLGLTQIVIPYDADLLKDETFNNYHDIEIIGMKNLDELIKYIKN